MGRQRQTTQSGPDAQTMRMFNERAGRVDQLIDSSPVEPYGGRMTADLSDAERSAMEFFQRLQEGGGGFAGADLSPYMNPYLDEVLGATMGDINRQRDLAVGQTGDAAMRAGAFGGSRHGVAQAETERAYGDIAARTAAGLRGDAFNQAAGLFGQDQNRMMQGAMGAAGIGGLQRQQEQMGLDREYQDFLRQYQDPFMRAQIQTGILGAMPRGSTTTQTQSGGGILGGALGIGNMLGNLGWAPFSDARLKRDVEPLGKRGEHNWYRFRYHWSDDVHEGVMAQEVLESQPEAVVLDPSGFYRVDYGALQ
jgi:hypothetical protein